MALALSAAVHVVIFFGIGHKPTVVPKAKAEQLIQLTITMPELKELEDEEPIAKDDGEQPDDPGMPVPTQADVPSIPRPSDFIQQLDFASMIEKPDLTGVKLTAIPEHILRGSKTTEGFGTIFNLADLDRIPEAVLQTPPVFPPGMKHDTHYAEVRVEFVVDATGRVVNPFVVQTTNGGFNDAAIRGVEKWKFRPGVRGGKKVNTRMQVPLIFRIVGAGEN
jgi:protein TonB